MTALVGGDGGRVSLAAEIVVSELITRGGWQSTKGPQTEGGGSWGSQMTALLSRGDGKLGRAAEVVVSVLSAHWNVGDVKAGILMWCPPVKEFVGALVLLTGVVVGRKIGRQVANM